MQIKFVSMLVEDQEKALEFYTTKLGFYKMADLPFGDYRWLTVSSPDGVDNVELLLEPISFAPAKVYQKALFDAGIPATAFITGNLHAEMERLKSLGVTFRGEPKNMGPITTVLFEDTCGNLINLVEPMA
jgi:catechol 2,3-dioxygenase-like lactoylglutathione lyase family enzyme